MLVEIAAIGLAAWRVSALFAYEKGPGKIFLRLREVLGYTHNEKGEPESWPDKFLPELISCPWCLSLWTSVLMWGIYQLAPEVVLVLAASTIVISIERWVH